MGYTYSPNLKFAKITGYTVIVLEVNPIPLADPIRSDRISCDTGPRGAPVVPTAMNVNLQIQK